MDATAATPEFLPFWQAQTRTDAVKEWEKIRDSQAARRRREPVRALPCRRFPAPVRGQGFFTEQPEEGCRPARGRQGPRLPVSGRGPFREDASGIPRRRERATGLVALLEGGRAGAEAAARCRARRWGCPNGRASTRIANKFIPGSSRRSRRPTNCGVRARIGSSHRRSRRGKTPARPSGSRGSSIKRPWTARTPSARRWPSATACSPDFPTIPAGSPGAAPTTSLKTTSRTSWKSSGPRPTS